MKGYLQRMALSAMTPVSRIHPLLAPSFASVPIGSEPVELEMPFEFQNTSTIKPGTPQLDHDFELSQQAASTMSSSVPLEHHVGHKKDFDVHPASESQVYVSESAGIDNSRKDFNLVDEVPQIAGNPLRSLRNDPPAAGFQEPEVPIVEKEIALARPGRTIPLENRLSDRFTFRPLVKAPLTDLLHHPLADSHLPGLELKLKHPTKTTATFQPLVKAPPFSHPSADSQPPEHEPNLEYFAKTPTKKIAAAFPVPIPADPIAPRLRRVHGEPMSRSQPNDVEIHIGRIEVTAVPPPAAPKARPPVRKALNLSEYLKRSH